MKFLEAPPRSIFFTGKGGVGKTSLACATAIDRARSGARVLLVSTDPASNIGQVFERRIGNTVTEISEVAGLFALEIDPHAVARQYREKIVGPVRGILPDTVVKGIEEQLSGACTTEIAAFDEFTALLTDSSLTADFDHIIFDTAPTGHTIRLLQLPAAWSGFLDAGKGDASCLGPLAGLEKQRAQYKAAVAALANPSLTRLVLVARAQQSSLREAEKTHRELLSIGITEQYLVINGILPESESRYDAIGAALYQREQEVLSGIPEALRGLPCDRLELKPFNMVGVSALSALMGDGTKVSSLGDTALDRVGHEEAPLLLRPLGPLVDEIAAAGHGLIMVVGKGGVGKTTVAAALAVELAHRGHPVHLTTSDPAAHVKETLHGAVPGLTVSRIDPEVETERYRQHVLQAQGLSLDEHGKALLEEDLRSPCTQEIAVFQAFSRILREAGERFVVMDTAPTGHTLLLLDATGAYHREVARQVTKTGSLLETTPMMQLQDPERTKVLVVTLAETTPVLEAAELQKDLRRAGIEPWAWIVNNSLAAVYPTGPILCKRAARELAELQTLVKHYARRYAVVPVLNREPVGQDLLRGLCRPTAPTLQP